MNKFLKIFFPAFMAVFFFLGCAAVKNGNIDISKTSGALSPAEALAYMTSGEEFFIVDVASPALYRQKHFTGAVSIPLAQISDRIDEIPENMPVIVHCRKGVLAPQAYEILKKERKDIKHLYYINGEPLIDEYNEFIQK